MKYANLLQFIINKVNMGIQLEVNGRTIEAEKGETPAGSLNRNGMHVPTICSLKDLLSVRSLPHVRG